MRIDYGDGEFAWETSKDEASEIIRCLNACQDAWEDFERDPWTDRDNEIRFPNQGQVSDSNGSHSPPHHPTRDAARELMGSVAMSVITSVAVKALERGINWVINWLCRKLNEDVEKADTVGPSVSDRLDRLEAEVGELKASRSKLEAILSNMSLLEVA